MAFTLRNLSVLAYANGFTLWHYKCGNATMAQVRTIGFFTDAADLLCEGDMVMVTGAEGGSIATLAGTGKTLVLAPLV